MGFGAHTRTDQARRMVRGIVFRVQGNPYPETQHPKLRRKVLNFKQASRTSLRPKQLLSKTFGMSGGLGSSSGLVIET